MFGIQNTLYHLCKFAIEFCLNHQVYQEHNSETVSESFEELVLRPGPSFIKPCNFTCNYAVYWSQLTADSQCSLRPVS